MRNAIVILCAIVRLCGKVQYAYKQMRQVVLPKQRGGTKEYTEGATENQQTRRDAET